MKTVKTFSLYLGAGFYFDLNLISAFYILLYFFLFISEKFIYLYIYSFIYLDFQRIKTYLIGLYPPRLTLLFAVSAVCEFSSKIMNKTWQICVWFVLCYGKETAEEIVLAFEYFIERAQYK